MFFKNIEFTCLLKIIVFKSLISLSLVTVIPAQVCYSNSIDNKKTLAFVNGLLRITQCSVLTITIGEVEHEVYFPWEQDFWIDDQEPYPHVS